ncbi:hypothetical protein ACTFIW_008549 [Dictyostelium discoideum]
MTFSAEQILTIFENKEEFQKLLFSQRNDYDKLQTDILDSFNKMCEELINIKKDAKTLNLNLDRITKVLNELFTKKTMQYKDGLSIVIESALLLLRKLSQWSITCNLCSLHKKWLLIGGVYAEQKQLIKAIESMSEFLQLLPDVQKTYTENENDYFEKTLIHATFIKLQCFEDLKVLQYHYQNNNNNSSSDFDKNFIETYNNWFNYRFQVADKPNIYHEALFIKFYNRSVYILQKYNNNNSNNNSGGNSGNSEFDNTIMYHCNFIAWKSLSKINNPSKFFDRLLTFLLAIQKKNYQLETNCWKLIQDIINIIKINLLPYMLPQISIDPIFIASFSIISIWANDSKNLNLLNEINEITSEYIKKKKENKDIIKYYSTELVITQLYCWTTRAITLSNRIKFNNNINNSSNNNNNNNNNINININNNCEITDIEKELNRLLISIHQLTEKALMNTEFYVDNSQIQQGVDSKFIYFKLLGLLLQNLIEIGIVSKHKEKLYRNELNSQIQLFNQYYLLMPSLIIKWIQTFNQNGVLLASSQMQPSSLIYIDDFLKSYTFSLYEHFKRFQGLIPQDFKSQFNDINRDLLTISLEYSIIGNNTPGITSSGLEDLSTFFYNIGTHYFKLTVPHDYKSSLFYLESSIIILNKLIQSKFNNNNNNSNKNINNNNNSNNSNIQIEQYYDSLSSSYFYLSQVYLKLKNYLKAHQFSVESIKAFLKEKKSFTEVIHNGNSSKSRRSIQEILRQLALTQLYLFNEINENLINKQQQQQQSSNGSSSSSSNSNNGNNKRSDGGYIQPKFTGISFINDIVDNSSIGNNCDLEFKIQLFDMTLLNFNHIITESNGHQLLYVQIDKILNSLTSDKHPILHGRFLMEKAKVLRFWNPMKQDIEFIFQQSIDLIKSQDLEQDKPFESAIYNELAKVHFWRAITHVEIHQNQCKDILNYLSNERIKQQNLTSTNGNDSNNNNTDTTTTTTTPPTSLFRYSSTTSICNFIKSTDQNRFRSPIGSENSIISKEFKLSLNLWSKLLESLKKPPTEQQQVTNSIIVEPQWIKDNLKSFISPHTTISLLYSMSDIYSFEGDFISSIFTLKLVIGLVKCLFSNGSLCYLTEISKCFNLISSNYLEMNNTNQSKHYLQLNDQLIKSYQSILVQEKLDLFQLHYQIHFYELQYCLYSSNDSICNEIIKLYDQCLKQIETNYKCFDISLFMKISKIVSNIYVSQTNSAMAFVVSDKLVQCIFTAMPMESLDLLKEQKKELKQQQQQQQQQQGVNSSNSSTTTTTPTKDNISTTTTTTTKEISMLPVTTTSKWASLKICLDSLLHISSIFELRGRPKEAQYFYERGLLIGIIYGSIKVTCEFLAEIGELFYSKQNYVDSKINLDLVLFLISRHSTANNNNNKQSSSSSSIIEPSLQKPMILSNMLLGDLHRKQLLISKSTDHYNKSLSLINNLYNDENQLLTKFNNLLNITNDSTPKEARLIKLLSSKSISATKQQQQQQQQQKLKNNDKDDKGVQEIKNHLSSFELRIKGKLAKLLIAQNKYDLAIESLEELIQVDQSKDGASGNTNGSGSGGGSGRYCHDITLSILEFHLGRAYYLSVDDDYKDKIWSRTISVNNFKVHPSISSARELLLSSFERVGKYNIIKLNTSCCKYLALTTGQLLPFVTCHFINLSIGIKSKHDMQSILHHQKSEKKTTPTPTPTTTTTTNSKDQFIKVKESLFSWNGGIEIPNQLGDIPFSNKLKKIYSTDLPVDWSTCSLTCEDDHLIICKIVANQSPILVRSKIPTISNAFNTALIEEINNLKNINKNSDDTETDGDDDDNNNNNNNDDDDDDDSEEYYNFDDEEDMELELEEGEEEEYNEQNTNANNSDYDSSSCSSDDDDNNNNDSDNEKYENNLFKRSSNSSIGNREDNISSLRRSSSSIGNREDNIKFNMMDKIRGNIRIIESENLFNNKENSPNETTDSKKAWFCKRKTLEFEISKVLDMVDTILGPWKTLLIGSLTNPITKDKYNQTKDSLMQILNNQLFIENNGSNNNNNNSSSTIKRSSSSVQSTGTTTIIKKFDNILFDCIFYGFPILSQRAITDGIIELMEYSSLDKTAATLEGHPNFQSILEIYNLISSEVSKCYPQYNSSPSTTTTSVNNNNTITVNENSSSKNSTVVPLVLQTISPTTPSNIKQNNLNLFLNQERQPIVLIVDKFLHCLPFESLAPLNQMSLYRLPSFTFQRYLCYDQISNQFSKVMPIIDPKSLYYLLNPSGGLKETENYFAPYFKKKFPEWDGLVGSVPSKHQYKQALENHDVFFYMGHGSGEQYFRGDRIQKLEKCGVSVLMGCKSGHLEEQGEFEPTGVILDFLLAGSKTVIGNIYDVPTSDCDRLTKSFLNKWFFDLKTNTTKPLTIDISLAISFARKSCDWKYLVGGSCICYGIPILLKSFNQ